MLPLEMWLRSAGRIALMLGAVVLGLVLLVDALTHPSAARAPVAPCPVLRCGPCDNCAPEPHP